MKTKFITALSVITLALGLNARAESTITLTGVHVCCPKCVKGITDAVSQVSGASAQAEKGSDKVTITAKSADDAKKAVTALVDAGYFGSGAEAPAVTDAKVKTLAVSGVHLCCQKCVDAFNKAATSATGVTKTDATKGAASVTVEGDFSSKELLAALNKNGFSGKVK